MNIGSTEAIRKGLAGEPSEFAICLSVAAENSWELAKCVVQYVQYPERHGSSLVVELGGTTRGWQPGTHAKAGECQSFDRQSGVFDTDATSA